MQTGVEVTTTAGELASGTAAAAPAVAAAEPGVITDEGRAEAGVLLVDRPDDGWCFG